MIKKIDLALFEGILQNEFKLRVKPVIQIKPKLVIGKDYCMGLYWEKYKGKKQKLSHTIQIARNLVTSRENLFSSLAHEFVHAWQAEKGIKVNHGKVFSEWRKYLKSCYNIDIVKD